MCNNVLSIRFTPINSSIPVRDAGVYQLKGSHEYLSPWVFALRPGFGLCVSSVKIVRGHVPSNFNIFYQDGGIIGVHRWNWVTSRYVL